MLDIPSHSDVVAVDPYAWVDLGERWVKEPRNLAPALDSLDRKASCRERVLMSV